ncbi:MAG: hypothetical protein AB1467_03405 [Candidatus Diapherotrites archaeon]
MGLFGRILAKQVKKEEGYTNKAKWATSNPAPDSYEAELRQRFLEKFNEARLNPFIKETVLESMVRDPVYAEKIILKLSKYSSHAQENFAADIRRMNQDQTRKYLERL